MLSQLNFWEDDIMDDTERKMSQPQESQKTHSGWLDYIEGESKGKKNSQTTRINKKSAALQFKSLIPGGVEAALYGLGLLLALAAGIWDQFELHVGV